MLILFLATLPVLLFGAKYVLDLCTSHDAKLNVAQNSAVSSASNTYKRCAGEVALAVAKNWNPGLTLGQQKDGIYKVADAVYNSAPAYSKTATKYEAIPGMDVPTAYTTVDKGSKFNPIKITYSSSKSLSPNAKTVGYSALTIYNCRWTVCPSYWNRWCGLWLGIDKGSDPANRISSFDEIEKLNESSATTKQKNEAFSGIKNNLSGNYILNHHDIYSNPHIYGCNADPSPTDSDYNSGWHQIYYEVPSTATSYSGMEKYSLYRNLNTVAGYKANGSNVPSTDSCDSTLSTITDYYFKRSTGTDANYVKISIASDSTHGGKIQVETDSDVSGHNDIKYAIPAQCNVDIVLAVPVNGAASNANNRDSISDTAENPLTYTSTPFPESIKTTPIYQMGQACKNFVKDNFYHVRGVSMGLIPYSGKLSISPDRATAWTVSFPQFVDTSTNTQLMIGSCLYGTQGQKDQPLKRSTITTTIKTNVSITAPYYWGGLQHGCPIMFRRGTAISSYGGNSYYGGYNGYLLNNTDPSTNDNYKYLRMNLNPCTVGYANQLSMKCEKACTYFSANPYYVIEPTADLVKIYEMCNALMPFYDPNNVSNFIFLPFEWANNFWQDWTNVNNPSASVSTGSGDSAVLKREAKISGRKKALILLVNKPDWFEPGEMTYLGFDNDFSEVPVVESDKIDFSINYTDTNKKYLDGTAYDSTGSTVFYGPKKILKYTKSSDTSGTLTFPRKGSIRLVVKAKGGGSGGDLSNWISAGSPLRNIYSGSWFNFNFAHGNGKFVAINRSSYVATSIDGITWNVANGSQGSTPLNTAAGRSHCWDECCYGAGKFIAFNSDLGYVVHSTDGITWSFIGEPITHLVYGCCYGNSKFIATCSDGKVSYSGDGTSWTYVGNPLYNISTNSWFGCCYGASKFVSVCHDGYVAYSTNGTSWTSAGPALYNVTGGQSNWTSCCYGAGKFLAINQSGYLAYSTDGINWTSAGQVLYSATQSTNSYRGIQYGGGKFVVVCEPGYVAYCEVGESGTGTVSITSGSNSYSYTISDEKPLIFTPDKLGSDTTMSITLSDAELVSAEITNATLSETVVNSISPVSATYNDTDYGADSGYGGASIETLSEDEANGIKTIRIKSKKSGTASVYLEKYEKGQVDLSNWNTGYSIPGDCCYRNRNFVYTGSQFVIWNQWNGQIATSTTGTSWSSSYSTGFTTGSNPGCIAYGNGIYVALTNYYSSYSTNLSSWASSSTSLSSISSSWWDGICYDGSQFVTVSRDGYIATSTNGSSWASKSYNPSSISSGEWRSIARGSGMYLVLHDSGYVAKTTSLTSSWTKIGTSLSNIASSGWYSIAYGRGVFVALNTNGYIAASFDNGANWSHCASLGSSDWWGICYGNNRFIAQQHAPRSAYCECTGIQPYYKIGSSSQVNVNSDTTISVSLSSTSGGYYYQDVKLCCLNVKSCVISYSATVDASYDNLSFTTLSYDVINGVQNVRLKSKKSGTAALYLEKYTKTKEGDITGTPTWEAKTTNLSNCGGTGSMYVYGHIGVGPVNGEEKLLIITNYPNGTLAYSSDGINWTQISQQLSSISSGGWVTGPAYGNGKWVIKSFSHGYAAVSTDGINWTGYSSGFTNNDATSILFANGRFYTMTSSTSYISTNGSSWSSLSSVPTYFNVANLNGVYYATKYGGTVYKSTDNGNSWNQLSNVNGISSDCYAITTVGEYLYSTGRSTQKVFRSRDGINWETVTTSAGNSDNITYYKGKLYLFPRSSTVYIGTFSGGSTIQPYYKIGSSSQVNVSSNTTISVSLSSTDSSGNYYADVQLCCLNVKSNAFTYSDTKSVDDLIPFYNNNTTSKNSSPRTLTYSGASGTHLGGSLYYRTGTGTITLANRGKLKLKIMPNLTTQSGTFAFTTGSDTSSKTITGTEEYTIEVDQQKVSGSQWQVSFSMTNIVLVTAEFISESFQLNPLNISLPNSSRSVYIDFSQTSSSKPYHSNSSCFIFGSSINGAMPSYTTYDSKLKRWCTTSGVNKFYDQILKYKGLMWLITEDLADSAAVKNLYYSTNASSSSSSQLSTYMPGLVRTTYTADQVWNYLGFETTNSKKTALTAAGITLPYNTALYAKYGLVESNAGLKQLMKDACSKLKTDHGTSNVRIYIVKFKEQTTHAERARNGEGMTNSSVTNDYSYFSDCTSYVYSATESNLKDKLNTIAEDIKSWVGYQNAKNVE